MRIGIALHQTNPQVTCGLTTYILGLLSGIKSLEKKHSYVLLTNEKNHNFYKTFESETIECVLVHPFSPSTFLKRIAFAIQNHLLVWPVVRVLYAPYNALLNKILRQEIQSLHLDVVYFPSSLVTPLDVPAPTVVSLHDIQHVHYPSFFSRTHRAQREVTFSYIAKHAARLQVSSLYMRHDFQRVFGFPDEKYPLILDGIEPEFKQADSTREELDAVRTEHHLPSTFVFYPAQHWKHKNHLTLIHALAVLKEQGQTIHLVCTGIKKLGSESIYEAVNSLGLSEQVHFIGNVPFSHIKQLYQLATVVCIPSLHESNSLPLVEALSLGTACVASDIEPNVELNTNGAITIFERLNAQDLAKKLLPLLLDEELRTKKATLGKLITQEYSWERAAHEYEQTFEAAAHSHA